MIQQDRSPMPGWVLHRYAEWPVHGFSIFLPPHVAGALESQAREIEREKAEGKVAQLQSQAPEAPEDFGSRTNAGAVEVPDQLLTNLFDRVFLRPTSEEAKAELAALFESTIRPDPSVRLHQVIQGTALVQAIVRARSTRDRPDRQHEVDLLRTIAERGAGRRVAAPGGDPTCWAASGQALRRNHPQFEAVTGYVENCVALSMHGSAAVRIAPILLVGPPGVGKSHYAVDLARALGVPVRSVSMENAQTTALLLGTERHWSSCAPGIIFDQIVLGEVANPLFLIEEIDKGANRGAGLYNPLNAFHTLLEPLNAASVRDAALEMAFDASLAIYLATANDIERLPVPLQSRFKIFHIERPSGAAALDLAHIVASAAIDKLQVPNFRHPDRALTRRIAHLTPRELTLCVPEAVGKALAEARRHLILSDFPADILDEDAPANGRTLH